MVETEQSDPVAARRALDRLPDLQRSALLLVCGEGLSYEAAAARLAVPTDALIEALLAARRTLVVGAKTGLSHAPPRAME